MFYLFIFERVLEALLLLQLKDYIIVHNLSTMGSYKSLYITFSYNERYKFVYSYFGLYESSA